MKKSKSMINESSNVYSGDDEGFESSAEKVLVLSILSMWIHFLFFVTPASDL